MRTKSTAVLNALRMIPVNSNQGYAKCVHVWYNEYINSLSTVISMSGTIRGRFAPSPSGRLHLGNMASSLLAWLDARSLGGEIIFRLEDLDPDRSYIDYARLMAEDLRWLGLDWDSGWPEDANFAQGARAEYYEAAFDELDRRGLIYKCWCSRAERLAASAPHPGEEHPGSCRCRYLEGEALLARLIGKRPAAYKCAVPDSVVTIIDAHLGEYKQNLAREGGDFIVRRSDGVFAYQLAVSVDDALMGVTRVVRAQDLLPSAPRQRWLIETLGHAAPEYAHAPLLTAPDGRKLSKRDGDLHMGQLRRLYTPEELTGRLAYLCGITDRIEPVKPRDLIPHFDWAKVPSGEIDITGVF